MLFPHRINRDGTIDSICSRCYVTIGTSTTEADLERIEMTHVCEPGRLLSYEEQRERAVKRSTRSESPHGVEAIKHVD
jgi:hypothetical protein